MIDLRKMAGIALTAGFLAGLSGCGKRAGDLGMDLPESPVIRTTEPVAQPAQLVELPPDTQANRAPATASVVNEFKEPSAELVSLRPAELAAVPPLNAAPAAVVPLDNSTVETKDAIAASEPLPAETAPLVPAPKAETADPVKAGDAPPPPPAPEPPPAPNADSKQAEAARLLEEASRLQSADVQARRVEADQAYQTGVRLMNDLEYEKAREYFQRAVNLDETHTAAFERLRTVNSLLGVHADRMKDKLMELENVERVRMQQNMVVLANSLEDARKYEDRGSVTATATEPDALEVELSRQLEALRKAEQGYRKVEEILNYMPPNVESPSLRAQVKEAQSRVHNKINEKEDALAHSRRERAYLESIATRERETEQFKARIRKMLDQVKDLYDRQDYRAAENFAVQILKIDPLNRDAESWKNKARGAEHHKERADTRDLYKDEYRNFMLDVEEASISNGPLIVYPPNWDQISKRADSASIGLRGRNEEAWKADIRKKLQRKVTFEFVDTPLEEAIAFLRSLSNVTMIVDPKVLAAGAPTINLRVTDMNLDLALEWILRLADLEYAYRDNAIFISQPQNLQAAVELRIYDVSDLIQTVQDFAGPELQLVTVGDTTAGPGGAGANPFIAAPTNAPTLTNIADMIRNRVRPDSWDPALGTSIEERGGKLVVMQRPEVHALIDQLLSNFRSTQKMMINIESRFLTIREAYLEDIGVEFQGLDPNVLLGDFGDIRRIGAPTGLIQPRIPGGDVSVPPNLPFPGFTNGPDDLLGGQFAQVGAIVNHVIGFFSNDPDTISGRDPSGAVRNGGLSAQVSVLNNAQVQAFVRALAMRENTSTLVAPRLTVFNTQRAHMFVARQQSYVADYEISGDSYDPVIRQFLEGVVLDVKPIVSSDRRYVTLEMRPTVTELVSFQTRQIDTFAVNNGANVTVLVQLALPIQFPELAIRRVRTTATVPDGGILLIAGLYRNIKFNAENGVPFLSDLPVIGRLFRWNVQDNVKSNLAILVSPRIILFSEEEEKL
jgi:Flp pilus assembly secretin CpaC/tetratricopeptide (TPR) repeat protein